LRGGPSVSSPDLPVFLMVSRGLSLE